MSSMAGYLFAANAVCLAWCLVSACVLVCLLFVATFIDEDRYGPWG